MTNERVPPHSEEAEKGVLGSLLMDSDVAVFQCNEKGVDENWFYIPAHRAIYAATMEVRNRGGWPDLLSVSDHLKKLGLLESIGGPMALSRIVDDTPTSAHVEHYISLLRESWIRRAAIAKARELERSAYAHDADMIQELGKSITGMARIASDRKTATTATLMQEHRRMRALAKSGKNVGWQTPWPQVNALTYGFREPHNIVIAAQTSTGKTALAANMIMHFIKQGARVAVSENDMSRMDLETRIVGMMTGINPLVFRTDRFTEEQEYEWDKAWDELGNMPLFINDDRMTMDETEAWALSQKARNGIDVFLFDFLQKTKRTKEEWRHSLREVVGDWSCRSCEIGKRMKAVTITVSQFSRSGNKEKDVTPPHPTLENLKETGEIENNADVVILLSKKPGQPVNLFTGQHAVWDIDADVAKHRNGPTGIIELSLHIRTQRFMSRAQGDDIRREIKLEEEKRMKNYVDKDQE